MAACLRRNWLALLIVWCCLAWALNQAVLAYDHPRDHGHQHRCDPPPGSGLPVTDPEHP